MAKKIIIKQLSLRNFKGIKDLAISFIGIITNIFGDNGTGKSTIFDAFTWLLFDKDSQDRVAGEKEANFQIKTLDPSGEALHGLEHEVIGVLNVDGKEVKLQKVYQEKWTKKRGEAEKEFTGHETLYYVDDVPVKKSEYQDKVNSFIDENIFKLITNPLYFSANMKWQDRRKVLLDIIGDISTEKVINYRRGLKALEGLLADKDLDTLKKSILARKTKLNNDIKGIPPRIDELTNSIQELDFDALDSQSHGILDEIKNIEEKLLDRSKMNEDVMKEKERLYQLKSKLKDIELEIKKEADKPLQELQKQLQEAEGQLRTNKSKLGYAQYDNKFKQQTIEQKEKRKEELKKKWYEENQKTFELPKNVQVCPTCQRPFETEDIETKRAEMEGNFNKNKANILKDITVSGQEINVELEKLKDEIAGSQVEVFEANIMVEEKHIENIKHKIEGFNPELNLDFNIEYQSLNKQIAELEDKISQPAQINTEVIDLKNRKKELELELKEINKKLNLKDQNEKFRTRIKQLMEEEKTLNQQVADIEKQEFLCEEFIKTKVELLESNINHKFRYVNFKLFDTQTNGGINECCEALVNGVPFSIANTASQYNAGVDIINALSDYYQVSAPIFIDNRESVSELINTDSQIVNLIKPPTWDELDEEVQRLLADIPQAQEEYATEEITRLEEAKKTWNDRNKKIRVEVM